MLHLLLKLSHSIFIKYTVYHLPPVQSTLLLLVWSKFKQMPFHLTEQAIACCYTCHSLVFGVTHLTLNINSATRYDKTRGCCQILLYLKDSMKLKAGIAKCSEKLVITQTHIRMSALYCEGCSSSQISGVNFHICFTCDW